MSDTIAIDNLARVNAVFHDDAGALADPTTVSIIVEDAEHVVTTYTYPGTITRVSLGTYYVDVSLTVSGTWYYRIKSTGAVQAATPDLVILVPESQL